MKTERKLNIAHILVCCFIIAGIFFLNGCGMPTFLVKDGKAIRVDSDVDEDYATISYKCPTFGIELRLDSVDLYNRGKYIFLPAPRLTDSFRVKLPPGKHPLIFGQVLYCNLATALSGGFYDCGSRSFEVNVEAGHKYHLKADLGTEKNKSVIIWLVDRGK